MASVNRVLLAGYLTRNVELRYTPKGTMVTDVGLAINDRRKNAEGRWTESVTYVDCTLWGRTAEVANEYLSKGSPLLVEGRLQLDTWKADDGTNRSRLKVVGERMQMLGTGTGKRARVQAGNGDDVPGPAAEVDVAPDAGTAAHDTPF